MFVDADQVQALTGRLEFNALPTESIYYLRTGVLTSNVGCAWMPADGDEEIRILGIMAL